MEEHNIENKENTNVKTTSQQQIAGAIILAGIIIAGAILLKGNTTPTVQNPANNGVALLNPAPVGTQDRTNGNPQAKVTLVLYEDFQCPFCGAISGLETNTPLIQQLKQRDPTWTPFVSGVNEYIKNGTVQLVYRDWAFLGPESIQSAEAARCAGDQSKFWEYHDYLYGHQNGENKGAFSDIHLKSFAKILGLDTNAFNSCLDTGKYAQAVADSKAEGVTAGVTGTPKGFIMVKGKTVATIDGAEPFTQVQQKIDAALK